MQKVEVRADGSSSTQHIGGFQLIDGLEHPGI
jgi:hypothetical protein